MLAQSPACIWGHQLNLTHPTSSSSSSTSPRRQEGGLESAQFDPVSRIDHRYPLRVVFVDENPSPRLDGQHRVFLILANHLPRNLFTVTYLQLIPEQHLPTGQQSHGNRTLNPEDSTRNCANAFDCALGRSGVVNRVVRISVIDSSYADDDGDDDTMASLVGRYPASLRRLHGIFESTDVLLTYHSRLDWTKATSNWLFPFAKYAGVKVCLTDMSLLPAP
eukprot:CAMPEP_0185790466 /NCGR_PEP_ID=MMETSP1174-20130828/156543_1 /TAXON_ID=35687 /ORGANISM="Dictyocha speculum, Strain CCMP1381" /LENGTH=219 /DNA_ID=CAMNT_0028485181 /DNA_START=126 /DNA_END=781 /DNA_ORIENTATION=+